jgi:subtilisin family serine protease
VAGIMTALGQENGIVGVAPEAELYAVRVGRVIGATQTGFSNELFETDLLEGIQWCIDNGIEVMNLSLFSRQTPALEQAIEAAYQKGIVMVAPSGNHRGGMEGSGYDGVDFPACDPRVIAVGAVGRIGTYPGDCYFQSAEDGALFSPAFPDYYIPGFSKCGKGLDFVAPGVAVLSTVPGNLIGYDVDNRRLSGYTTWMGTSQASPFIAGLAALILEARPDLRGLPDGRRIDAVRAVMARSAISLQLDPLYQGAGLPYAPACVAPDAGLG